MPYPAAAPQDVRDTYRRYHQAVGAEELAKESETVCARIGDIEAEIYQAPVATLHGALSKVRVAWHVTAASEDLNETEPDFDGRHGRLDDPVFIWAILQDLEHLAGEA